MLCRAKTVSLGHKYLVRQKDHIYFSSKNSFTGIYVIPNPYTGFHETQKYTFLKNPYTILVIQGKTVATRGFQATKMTLKAQ